MDSALTQQVQELLIYRQRLLDSLLETDVKIRARVLSEQIPELDDVPQLLEYRDHLYLTQKRYEDQTKEITIPIRDALASNGLPKYENATHIAQIMYPPPRKTIEPEKLLLAGVAPSIIVEATKETAVAPFLRVDRRRGT